MTEYRCRHGYVDPEKQCNLCAEEKRKSDIILLLEDELKKCIEVIESYDPGRGIHGVVFTAKMALSLSISARNPFKE